VAGRALQCRLLCCAVTVLHVARQVVRLRACGTDMPVVGASSLCVRLPCPLVRRRRDTCCLVGCEQVQACTAALCRRPAPSAGLTLGLAQQGSVLEGRGGKLTGTSAMRLRNTVLRQTGFLEVQAQTRGAQKGA